MKSLFVMAEQDKVEPASWRIVDQTNWCIDVVAKLKTDRVERLMKIGSEKEGRSDQDENSDQKKEDREHFRSSFSFYTHWLAIFGLVGSCSMYSITGTK